MWKILALVVVMLCANGMLHAQETSDEALIKRGTAALEKEKFDDAIAAFTDAIRLNPKNAAAYNSRGLAKLRKSFQLYMEARADFSEAIRLAPQQAEYYLNRGRTYPTNRPMALDDFNKAIQLNPKLTKALTARGFVHCANAKFAESRKQELDAQREYALALADYDEALRIDPHMYDAFIQRGRVWQSMKDFDKALADFSEAIHIDPENDEGYIHRAGLYRMLGKGVDLVIEDYSNAIRLNPDSALLWMRGQLWEKQGEFARAIEDYTAAIRLKQDGPLGLLKQARALNARAWIYATCPVDTVRDDSKAVKDAEKAWELLEQSQLKRSTSAASYLNTLAAAYAEAGDFDKAVETINKAIETANERRSGYAERLAAYKERLALYQNKKPYREPLKPLKK